MGDSPPNAHCVTRRIGKDHKTHTAALGSLYSFPIAKISLDNVARCELDSTRWHSHFTDHMSSCTYTYGLYLSGHPECRLHVSNSVRGNMLGCYTLIPQTKQQQHRLQRDRSCVFTFYAVCLTWGLFVLWQAHRSRINMYINLVTGRHRRERMFRDETVCRDNKISITRAPRRSRENTPLNHVHFEIHTINFRRMKS